MKSLAFTLSALLISSLLSTNTWAGERGRHWHGHGHHPQHHSRHHHHHHHYGRGHDKGAYLIGGLVLGAVVSELARPRDSYVKETVYVTRTDYERPQIAREYRLDRDGRCYQVDDRGDRRVLLEVPRSACY